MNDDTLSVFDGEIVDDRLEILFHLFVNNVADAPNLDDMFNAALAEYVSGNIPGRVNAAMGMTSDNAVLLVLAQLFGMTVAITFPGTDEWPAEGFPYAPPAACYAVAVKPRHGVYTAFCPGVTLNSAFLAALTQYMRDHAYMRLNQAGLPLN